MDNVVVFKKRVDESVTNFNIILKLLEDNISEDGFKNWRNFLNPHYTLLLVDEKRRKYFQSFIQGTFVAILSDLKELKMDEEFYASDLPELLKLAVEQINRKEPFTFPIPMSNKTVTIRFIPTPVGYVIIDVFINHKNVTQTGYEALMRHFNLTEEDF